MQPNRDDQVIALLGKLKDAGPEYPSRLFADRRTAVLAGLAVVQVGGAVVTASWIARLIKLFKAMGLIDKIILAVELVAVTGLTTYGAVETYVYRNVLRQMLFPSASTAFPTLSIPPSATNIVATPTAGSRTPTPTGTLTVTVPPLFTQGAGTPQAPGSTSLPGQPTQPPPTSKPAGPTPTHGLHLGQTPGTPVPPHTPKP